MSQKKVIYLKDYTMSVGDSLMDKIVVGSDILPVEAVELAIKHRPVQVVVDGFDEQRVLDIRETWKLFCRGRARQF